jgi:predicted dehydrogenase
MSAARLDLAVVGCGRVFQRYHLPALRACQAAGADFATVLVAACEVEPARRTWAERELGIPCFQSVDELLGAVHVDAALVCTPPDSHSHITARLLVGGAHVLVEKPMSLSSTEARTLADAAKVSDRVLRVGFNRRFRADYAELRRRSRTSGVQKVTYTFVAEAGRWSGAVGGATSAHEHALHDAGSHALDLIAHLGGRIEQLRAVARARGSDATVDIEARLASDIEAACTVGRAPRYKEALEIESTQGEVLSADASGGSLVARIMLVSELVRRRLDGTPTRSQRSFHEQMRSFLSACRGEDDLVGAGIADGLASVAAVSACLRSLAEGGTWLTVGDTPHANAGKSP